MLSKMSMVRVFNPSRSAVLNRPLGLPVHQLDRRGALSRHPALPPVRLGHVRPELERSDGPMPEHRSRRPVSLERQVIQVILGGRSG